MSNRPRFRLPVRRKNPARTNRRQRRRRNKHRRRQPATAGRRRNPRQVGFPEPGRNQPAAGLRQPRTAPRFQRSHTPDDNPTNRLRKTRTTRNHPPATPNTARNLPAIGLQPPTTPKTGPNRPKSRPWHYPALNPPKAALGAPTGRYGQTTQPAPRRGETWARIFIKELPPSQGGFLAAK